MSRVLSLAMQMALFAQETNDIILPLLTISHPGFSEIFRVVLDGVDLVSRGNTFYSYPFDIIVPDDSAERPPQATITIDNIDRRITAALETTLAPASVTIEIVRKAAPNTVEAVWTNLVLKSVTYNKFTISGIITYENFTSETYPAGTFSPAYFPGLF